MIGAVISKPSFSKFSSNETEIRELLSSFSTLYTFPQMGGDFFAANFSNTESLGVLQAKGYVDRFPEIIRKIIEKGADVLITVGGDGIASYSASAIIKYAECKGITLGIIGYPAGTANIGPIVQRNISTKSLNRIKKLDAIEVAFNGKVIGYGFNDVIFGNTMLGTMSNKWANIDALQLAKNCKIVSAEPSSKIVRNDFEIILNDKKLELSDWKGKIAQICISTLHQDKLSGRAVMGGLSESIGYEHPAAIALLDKVSVDARPETWNCQVLRNTGHLCFSEKDTIVLKNFEKTTCVMIDGNPFEITGDEITIKCKANAIPVFGCWEEK